MQNEYRNRTWHLSLLMCASLIIAATVSVYGLQAISGESDRPARPRSMVQRFFPGSIRAMPRLPDFVALIKKVGPAVVNISSKQVIKTPEMFSSFLEGNDRHDDFWKKYFGSPFFPQGPFAQLSLGSGFIIDPDGLILTNHHVVEDAGEIMVRLADGRQLEAEVVGQNPEGDVSLIRVDNPHKLPAVRLGNSANLRVGEWVLAMGNPFGREPTASAGIVGLRGANVEEGPYDDFIHTNASIHPGNSGGPLINLRGEAVGINTAVYSRARGNIGIGFAAPIDLAKSLLPRLENEIRSVGGWLGVIVEQTPAAVGRWSGFETTPGARVAIVTPESPADRGGIETGDVIVEFDGNPVERPFDLPLLVARTPAGKRVEVEVIRDGREMILYLTIGERPDDDSQPSAGNDSSISGAR